MTKSDPFMIWSAPQDDQINLRPKMAKNWEIRVLEKGLYDGSLTRFGGILPHLYPFRRL